MVALLLALVGALGLGLSDYLGGFASRRVPAVWVIACTYPLSIVFIAAVVPFVDGEPTVFGFLWGAGAGLATGAAVWTFYEALARGPMSIISPVAAVITAGLPVVAGLALGERPSPVVLLGIVGAIVATVLVSLEAPAGGEQRRFTSRIAALTVISGVLFGLYLIVIAYAPGAEGLYPVLWSRVGATAVIVTGLSGNLLLRRKTGRSVVARIDRAGMLTKLVPLAVVIALLDVVSNTAYFLSTQHGMLSVVAVVTSLYPAVTVLAALTHGGERLRRIQALGLVAAAAAVVVITLG